MALGFRSPYARDVFIITSVIISQLFNVQRDAGFLMNAKRGRYGATLKFFFLIFSDLARKPTVSL
jgi:hypothetical protein